MGAYQYCPDCGHALDAPTEAEILISDTRDCENCGAEHLHFGDKETLVYDLLTRLEAIEKALGLNQ